MLANLVKGKKTFIIFVTILGFIFGTISFLNIPKEDAPSMDLPMYTVNIIAPGLDPNTVEKQIVTPVEQEFKAITNIKNITAIGSFNYAMFILEFHDEKSKTDAINDIKSALDKKIGDFPDNTKSPVIKQISPNDSPVYTFSIVGEYINSVLYNKTKTLEDTLKSVQGVSEVNVIGKPNKSINLDIDYDKLNKFGLDISTVYGQLNGVYFNYAADKKELSNGLYSYEISNYKKDIDYIIEKTLDFDVINNNGQRIKFQDIGNVYYQEVVDDKKSFLMTKNEDGKYIGTNAISFQLKVTPGADVESVIETAMLEVDEFLMDHPELTFYETNSKLDSILDMFGTFVSNFRQSGLLVMAFVLLFLGLKASGGISIAFPLIYLLTFLLLKFAGYSFNNIVSFALVLTLGIMVDNLIVITEGIISEFKNGVTSYWEAVQNSYNKYLLAILAGTSITIMMFLPLYFMLGGMMGAYLKPLPITIAFTLISSFIVASLILPVLASNFLDSKKKFKKPLGTILLEGVSAFLGKIVKFLVSRKIYSFFAILVTFVMLFSSFSLVASGIVKSDFMPATDQDNIYMNIKYAPGITLEQNQKNTKDFADISLDFFEKNYEGSIVFVDVNLGNHYSSDAASAAMKGTANNLSYMTLKLVDDNKRNAKSFEMAEKFQSYLPVIKNQLPFVKDVEVIGSMGIGGGKPVGFELQGNDIIDLNNYYESILPELEKIEGMYNIGTNIEYTNGKIKYIIDMNKAKEYGINAQAAAILLMAIQNSDYKPYGLSLGKFNEFDKDTINMNAFVKHEGDIGNLKIGDKYFDEIIESKELQPELKGIQHNDGKLTLVVSSDKLANIPLGQITTQIEDIVNANPPAKGIDFGFGAEVEIQNEAGAQLGSALGVGIIIGLIILVLKFNSIKYGIIILSTTMLSITGVLFILAAFGMPLSFPAQLGLFGVMGVGINNGILFIERYLANRKSGKFNVQDALVDTMQARFISIFLTSATTIGGLVTLALKDELWGGLAISFIGGLLANMVLVFFYLPSLLNFINREKTNVELKK